LAGGSTGAVQHLIPAGIPPNGHDDHKHQRQTKGTVMLTSGSIWVVFTKMAGDRTAVELPDQAGSRLNARDW
jgi:hypothetical protein